MAIDPEFQTPGDAVAGQLQDILARKRAVARQSMLDQIQQQNMQSEMQYRAEQAASNKEQREAHAQDYLAQQRVRDAQTARENQEDIDYANFMKSPEFAKLDPRIQAGFNLAQHADRTQRRQLISDLKPPTSDATVPGLIYDEDTKSLKPAVGPDGKPWMTKPGERPLIQPRAQQQNYAPVGFTPDPNKPGNFLATFFDTKNPNQMVTRPVGAIQEDPRHPNPALTRPDVPLFNENAALQIGRATPGKKMDYAPAFINSVQDMELKRDLQHVIDYQNQRKAAGLTPASQKDIMAKHHVPDQLNPRFFKTPQDYTDALTRALSAMGIK